MKRRLLYRMRSRLKFDRTNTASCSEGFFSKNIPSYFKFLLTLSPTPTVSEAAGPFSIRIKTGMKETFWLKASSSDKSDAELDYYGHRVTTIGPTGSGHRVPIWVHRKLCLLALRWRAWVQQKWRALILLISVVNTYGPFRRNNQKNTNVVTVPEDWSLCSSVWCNAIRQHFVNS